MFNVLYNSQDLEYKKPFGAVALNTNINFKIKTNASCDVKIIIKTLEGFEEYELEYLEKEKDYYIYSIELDSSSYLGPFFYYFKILKDGQTFYYTNNDELLGGVGKLCTEKPDLFYHGYVYDLKYDTPEWFKTGIIYHVFVDRFNNDDCSLESVNKDLVEVYGGNLRGIINKLDYLQDLGVSILLLSPIFESKSHHKYDVDDYKKIAEDYGDLDVFKELLCELKKRDMHIILDGVFNHSGSNSKYFNKYGNYDSLGAYQSVDSKYYEWYKFNEFPDNYDCWQGIDTLPEFNQENQSFLNYFFYDENSVVNYWMNLGIDGWRLDAADLLSDKLLSRIFDVVKKNNPDTVIIGELWNDATHFRHHSHGTINKFICGNELESVINYPLHGLILEYTKGNYTPQRFRQGFYSLMENYPKEYFYSLVNFLSTHDIERVFYLLDGNFEYIKLAIVLSLTLPGVPLIYYGDEVGLDGGKDPDNRRPLPWGNINNEIYDHYKSLCLIRKNQDILKKGSIYFIENQDFLIYKRTFDGESIYVIFNNFKRKNLDVSILSEKPIKLKDIESENIYEYGDSISIDESDYKILLELVVL